MKLNRKLRTDRRLWLLFSVVAFVLLGFVHPMSEAVEYKSGPSNFRGILLDPHVWRSSETMPMLLIFAMVLLITALVLGWVAQALVVAIQSPFQGLTSARDSPASSA